MIPVEAIALFVLFFYCLMMWYFAYGIPRSGEFCVEDAMHEESLPGISVVVAARNESNTITGLLDALNRQRGAGVQWEVIVADDHSTDDTAAVCSSFRAHYPLTVVQLRGSGIPSGKKSALDEGIRRSKYSVILITDADTRPPEGWIASYRNTFADPVCTFAAGLVRLEGNITGMQAVGVLDFYGLVGAAAGAAGRGWPFMCNGANMGFRKEHYHKSGGMEKHLHLSSGDDVMLLHQFIKRFGASTVRWLVHPSATVETKPPDTFGGLIRQRVRWASKSKGYKNGTSIAVATTVLLANLAVVGATLMALSGVTGWLLAGSLVSLKMVADFPLLLKTTRLFRQTHLMWWYVPSSLLYPWYTTAAGLLSLAWKPVWKGRNIKA